MSNCKNKECIYCHENKCGATELQYETCRDKVTRQIRSTSVYEKEIKKLKDIILEYDKREIDFDNAVTLLENKCTDKDKQIKDKDHELAVLKKALEMLLDELNDLFEEKLSMKQVLDQAKKEVGE